MNEKIMAAMVVFGVICVQTLIISIQHDYGEDKVFIFTMGFMIADLLSALTWFLFGRKDEM